MQSWPLGAVSPIDTARWSAMLGQTGDVIQKHVDVRKLVLELACQKHASPLFPAACVQEAETALKDVLRRLERSS